MSALQQMIDIHLEERSAPEIASAYRALCSSVLVKTALALASRGVGNWAATENRRVAKNWLKGGIGTVEFKDVCEVLDLDPDKARAAIHKYVEEMKDPTIKKSRKPVSHKVFGRNYDARETQSPA